MMLKETTVARLSDFDTRERWLVSGVIAWKVLSSVAALRQIVALSTFSSL